MAAGLRSIALTGCAVVVRIQEIDHARAKVARAFCLARTLKLSVGAARRPVWALRVALVAGPIIRGVCRVEEVRPVENGLGRLLDSDAAEVNVRLRVDHIGSRLEREPADNLRDVVHLLVRARLLFNVDRGGLLRGGRGLTNLRAVGALQYAIWLCQAALQVVNLSQTYVVCVHHGEESRRAVKRHAEANVVRVARDDVVGEARFVRPRADIARAAIDRDPADFFDVRVPLRSLALVAADATPGR